MTRFPVGVMLASMATERFGGHRLAARIAIGAALLYVGIVSLQAVIRSTGSDLNPYGFAMPFLICGIGMATAIMSCFDCRC
ncbi:hypothetical protein [uncultured Tateyamaria sp.]|uniref:hypothetical protein n=1 Tax=uncultured Tateyamaria sp. TaxID=455651 RepID=UPI0026095E74|nr:hypothetical protein [uncultured Tateyamaria sp.]